jgi:CRISPR-associated protein Cas1
LGTLHAPRAGHAALASDLIEEFRAPVVDTVVMATVLGERIQPSDFVLGDDGQTCLLNEHARRTFVRDLTDKLRSSLMHPVAKVRMDYHRAMHWQVHHYRQIIEGQLLVYEPFVLR